MLGHEVSHVANGDMVTMALLQGVLNTFVIVLARVVGRVVDGAISGDRDRGPGFGYYIAVSYTHLDVYKRQAHKRVSVARGLWASTGSAALDLDNLWPLASSNSGRCA